MDAGSSVRINDYPLLKHYGSLHSHIDREAARLANFDERINSIGRYLVGRTIKFWKTMLSSEGKTTYDPEDIFLELYSELRKRNDKYNHERADYIIFAGRIINNKLIELLERAHGIKLPANAASKFKSLSAEALEGTISESRRARLAALIAAATDHAAMSPFHECDDDGPDGNLEKRETNAHVKRRKEMEDKIQSTVSALTIRQCTVVRHVFGLWGTEILEPSQIDEQQSWERGTSAKELVEAKEIIREALGQSWQAGF